MTKPFYDERRPQTSRMIQELLDERKLVWAVYCELGGMKPFVPGRPLAGKIQEFCQLLIDYMSLGHFGVYRRIIDRTERRSKAIATARAVYPEIEEATDVALAFNDKYESLEIEALQRDLEADLSRLGEALAIRFELEDQLMTSLLF